MGNLVPRACNLFVAWPELAVQERDLRLQTGLDRAAQIEHENGYKNGVFIIVSSSGP